MRKAGFYPPRGTGNMGTRIPLQDRFNDAALRSAARTTGYLTMRKSPRNLRTAITGMRAVTSAQKTATAPRRT